MYASKNDHILCVENLLKTTEVNIKYKDNVSYFSILLKIFVISWKKVREIMQKTKKLKK